MNCDICGLPAKTQWVTGNFCAKHEDSLRMPYFAFLKDGKVPSDYLWSTERRHQIAEIRAKEAA